MCLLHFVLLVYTDIFNPICHLRFYTVYLAGIKALSIFIRNLFFSVSLLISKKYLSIKLCSHWNWKTISFDSGFSQDQQGSTN